MINTLTHCPSMALPPLGEPLGVTPAFPYIKSPPPSHLNSYLGVRPVCPLRAQYIFSKIGVYLMSKRQPLYGKIFAGHDEGEAMAEHARVLWAEYKADLEDRKLFTPTRGRMVDRLVRIRVEYDTYYPVAIHDGPVRLSSDGNQYVNMLWSQCQKMSDQILKLETALTITPQSIGSKVEGAGSEKTLPTGAKKYLERSKAH